MKRKQVSLMWLTPILLALPVIAALSFAAFMYGETFQKLIQVVIKLAVTK